MFNPFEEGDAQKMVLWIEISLSQTLLQAGCGPYTRLRIILMNGISEAPINLSQL